MREPLQIRYIHYGGIPAIPEYLPSGKTYSPNTNLSVACALAGISVEQARSPSRTRYISYKRFHVMAILRSWGRSLPQIGRMLNRDHTSILNGLRRWEENEDLAIRVTPAKRPRCPHEIYVSWHIHRANWQVRVPKEHGGYIGAFTDYDEAVAARDAALSSTPINEEAA